MSKQTFGVIVTTRSFFPSHLVETARRQITEALDAQGFGYVMLGSEDTDLGAVLTYEEAKTCARLFKAKREEISGIIVILPNFGEELGVAEAIHLAGLDVPILIQACNDDYDKLDMENRRDAFCGKLSLCNNLYQRGIRYSTTTLHTCDIDGPDFADDLRRFAGVCRVVQGIRGSRIAMLGARPIAFNTVRFSEKILQRNDISVQTVDMSEVIAAAKAYSDSDKIAAKVEEIRAFGTLPAGLPDEKLVLQAKLILTMEDFVEQLDCQASSVQCWDSIENNYGCATCLGMAMMGDQGKPSACESDVCGALSMLAARLAADSAPALMDWNNNVDNERNSCISLHCSNFPKSFFANDELELGSLDVLGSVLGSEKTFGAIKGSVSAGPMTFIRLSTDDPKGIIKGYVGEGHFSDVAVPTKGGVAYCEVENLQALLKYMCDNGFEHHVCFVRGHVADILEEALAKYLQVEMHRHGA